MYDFEDTLYDGQFDDSQIDKHELVDISESSLDDFDWFISPQEARGALNQVKASAESYNTDITRAATAGKISPSELEDWRGWYSAFSKYYVAVSDSTFGWRLIDSAGVMERAERFATDLGMWRQRFVHWTNERTTTATPTLARLTAQSGWGTWSIGLAVFGGIAALSLASRIVDIIDQGSKRY